MGGDRGGRAVSVWEIVPLRQPNRSATLASLSPRELEHASRLPGSRRDVYLTGRAALRLVLGAMIAVPPEDLSFRYRCDRCGDTQHGKPRLDGSPGIDFSISYSERSAVLAVTSTSQVGVDVEAVAAHPLTHRWCYSEEERRYLKSLPEREQRIETARAWVRKEALAKACGQGLTMPLSIAEVSGPRAIWRLPAPQWHVVDLAITGGAVAALAIDSPTPDVRVERWQARPP